jgi:hypothetical protein
MESNSRGIVPAERALVMVVVVGVLSDALPAWGQSIDTTTMMETSAGGVRWDPL